MKKKISDPWIAKEKFNNISKVKEKLSKETWVEFINNNTDYFIWLENTERGKKTLANLDKIPESFKNGVLRNHDKQEACAEFNQKKGYHEVVVQFNERLGVIGTTIQKPITKAHLRMLLDMANHLDAYLLNNGTEIIDEAFLKSLD